MKIKNILILAALVGSFSACADLIEPALENIQTEEQMFRDPSSAQGILGYAYANLPFETKSTTDIATDDAVTNDLGNNLRAMAQGTWTANNNPVSQWDARKSTIQYLNLFIKNAANVPWSDTDYKQAMFVDKLLGEAYALRALNMYYLLRNHAGWTSGGELLGVPIILEPEGAGSDFNQPRATFKACVEQIYADIDAAMELIPMDYADIAGPSDIPAKYQKIGVTNHVDYNMVFGSTFRGRMSGRIAEAVKAQVALLAASPAYAEGSGVTYEDAANAAATVLNRIGGLSGVDPKGYRWFMEGAVIDGLASGQNPAEILWRGSINQGTEDYAFGINQEKDNFPPTLYGSGRINPTQNLVDAFPMANGYPITDSQSGYSKNNPYADRDPRLSEYVLYNGAVYKDVQIITGAYSSDDNGLNKTANSTRTGYYLRKLLREDCNPNPSATNAKKHYPVYMRYTEFYLAYAEAANEAWGPDGKGSHGYSAYDVIKALRARAGVGAANGDAYLESVKSDKAKMRELIRNERRIEMCFENKRFWDMRRWKLDLNSTAMGVSIKQAGGSLSYEYIEVEPRNYRDHMYYGPIPETEVLKWSNLDQNMGW
ncbi:MAG: RagB/SusD family nutrient uptake outer membrane protein [Bacteroidales bacterium]|nr:RagB/SusD family nutrient uptake outer membrane protein [Bacteroidales bacterium]